MKNSTFSQKIVIGNRSSWTTYYYFNSDGIGFYLGYRDDDFTNISYYGIEEVLDRTIRQASRGIDYEDNPKLPKDVEKDVVWAVFDSGMFY